MCGTTFDAVCVCKVADMGLTRRLYNEAREQSAHMRLVANPLWLAPEIIRSEPYATASDVYPVRITPSFFFFP
mgnify:CR=1 FL=1